MQRATIVLPQPEMAVIPLAGTLNSASSGVSAREPLKATSIKPGRAILMCSYSRSITRSDYAEDESNADITIAVGPAARDTPADGDAISPAIREPLEDIVRIADLMK
ncbi:hypothetical protein [Bradyrhizobium sp. DASA03007]|uniref:hypothetical protein n=1 Tax=unclassified Bradyrhizobium TaxID=2631580 RepID=UPI003F6F6F7B